MSEKTHSTDEPAIRTLATREVYRNAWLRLHEDRVVRANGREGIYGWVDKDDCAIILPIDGDRIWLVEQYRYTIRERVWELPQGGWERSDVDPEELARGELREETGLRAGRMTPLGFFWVAYGFARQRQFVYLAEELTQGERDLDEEEQDLIVADFSISDFENMLADGRIKDSSALSAWTLYQTYLKRNKKGE